MRMKRLPTLAALELAIDTSMKELNTLRSYLPELLRRREHDAGRDGYPANSMGGGSSSTNHQSSTEMAALGDQPHDPVGQAIDGIFESIQLIDKTTQSAIGRLDVLQATEASLRGRQATVETCDACAATITGIGDDRKRAGFCRNCFKSWRTWQSSPLTADSSARPVFIAWRRQRLKEKATA